MTTAETETDVAGTVRHDDQDHVFHSWFAQRGRKSLAVAGAEGSWFSDLDGRRYLDLASKLVFTNIGHGHPRVVAAIKEQADRLCTLAPAFANDRPSEAARLIAGQASGDLDRAFFTSGGGRPSRESAGCSASSAPTRTARRSGRAARPRSASGCWLT